jgi:hypothetical protein
MLITGSFYYYSGLPIIRRRSFPIHARIIGSLLYVQTLSFKNQLDQPQIESESKFVFGTL